MSNKLILKRGTSTNISTYENSNYELFTNTETYELNIGTGTVGSYRKFIPLPITPATTTFLRADGTWAVPPTTSGAGDLTTTSSSGLVPETNESLSGSISLHKISKTGSFNDLLDAPVALKSPYALTISGQDSTSVSYDGSIAKSLALTKSMVGLSNVENVSKATMFTNAALTGTPTAPTAATATNNTQIASTAYVNNAIADKLASSKAMVCKGTIGVGGDLTALPTTYFTGWTYTIITAGTYAGEVCEVGDTITAKVDRAGSGNLNSDWFVLQKNIDGAATVDSTVVAGGNVIAIFDSSNKYLLKSIGYGTSGANKIVQRDSSGEILGTPAILIVGASASATSNAAVASGNSVFVNLYQNSKVRSTTNLVGGSNVQIVSDANGKITFSATNTVYTHPSSYTAGTYFACSVNNMGHVISGSTDLDFGTI